MNLNVDTLWYVALLVLKWAFIALIYWALWLILKGVWREMGQRVSADAHQPAAAPGRLRVLADGRGTGLHGGMVIPLQPETRLGANRANDLVIHDPYVSRQHARLRWDGLGWWIQDLGSRNGTFVNEQRCPVNQEIRVPFGARLRVGDEVFELLP
jgi:hypothetical protein